MMVTIKQLIEDTHRGRNKSNNALIESLSLRGRLVPFRPLQKLLQNSSLISDINQNTVNIYTSPDMMQPST